MIYVLLGLFAAMTVVGAVAITRRGAWNKEDWRWDCAMFVFGILLSVPLSIIVGAHLIGNGRGLAEWQAFYQANTVNYEVAVDRTASYLSIEAFESVLVQGSIEKLEQVGYVSERIKEWRDAVNEYNRTIASMKFFDSNAFTGVLVPDEVQDMKYIIIR